MEHMRERCQNQNPISIRFRFKALANYISNRKWCSGLILLLFNYISITFKISMGAVFKLNFNFIQITFQSHFKSQMVRRSDLSLDLASLLAIQPTALVLLVKSFAGFCWEGGFSLGPEKAPTPKLPVSLYFEFCQILRGEGSQKYILGI